MWALYILAGLVILILAILSVPLNVRINAEVFSKPKLRLAVDWLFGLVSFNVFPQEKRVKEAEKKAVRKRRRKSGPMIKTFFRVLRIKGLVRRVLLLIKTTLKKLRFKDITADFQIGIDDPADLGKWSALVNPAMVFVRPYLPKDIVVRPVVDAAIIEGFCRGTLRIWPVLFIPPLLRFFFSVPVLRAAQVMAAAAWRSRKKE